MPTTQVSLFHDDREDVVKDLKTRFMQWTIDERHTPFEGLPAKPPVEELDTEFKRDFPPDAFGHEVDDNARVWKVYRAQATAHDDTLLDGWNAALDILLIFAGLFSAVATAFLIESYQALQFDKDAFVANALYLLVAASNATDGALALPVPPPIAPSPSPAVRWINGLWFASLILALAVALLSILVKQWLREYKARNTVSAASPRQWAHRRTFLYSALETWRVADLISVLPLLLHAALFLFLAGTALFLWDLDRSIALLVVCLGSALGALYAVSICIPLWKPHCPTSTPLVNLIRKAYISISLALLRSLLRSVSALTHLTRVLWQTRANWVYRPALLFLSYGLAWPFLFYRWFDRLRESCRDWLSGRPPEWIDQLRYSLVWDAQISPRDSVSNGVKGISNLFGMVQRTVDSLQLRSTDDALIRDHVGSHGDDLDGSALLWLITSVSDSNAVAVALQAIGGLRPSSRAARTLRRSDAVRSGTPPEVILTCPLKESSVLEKARVARTWHIVGVPASIHDPESDAGQLVATLRSVDSSGSVPYPDLVLLGNIVPAHYEVPPDLRYSPSATATVMTLLHHYRIKGMYLLDYCDFSSPAMDWDVMLDAAASEVYPGIWADVPQSSAPTVFGAARACRALCAILMKYRVTPHEFPYIHDLGKSIVRLMSIASPGFLADNAPCTTVYGSNVLDLVDFFESAIFPIDDADAIIRALFVLQAAAGMYLHDGRTFETRRVIEVAGYLLLRYKPSIWLSFVDGMLEFARLLSQDTKGSASDRSDLLSRFLLQYDRGKPTSLYRKLWLHTEDPEFFNVLSHLTSWLLSAEEGVQEFWTHSSRKDLVGAFLEEMRFIPLLHNVSRYSGFERYGILLRISMAYREFRPSAWLRDLGAAQTDNDELVRAIAAELQVAMERGSNTIYDFQVGQRLRAIRAAAQDEEVGSYKYTTSTYREVSEASTAPTLFA